MVHKYVQAAITSQRLDEDYHKVVEKWHEPVARDIAALRKAQQPPLVIGIQGCQGSGKSTLASFLQILLEHKHNLKTVVLSIDDFYHTRAVRRTLAQSVHPLLATRGVPGTHDVDLACAVIDNLCKQGDGVATKIPRFDKSADDRKPRSEWDAAVNAVDVIIFEGWCVGATAQAEEALLQPLNTLEAEQDKSLVWRRYVNAQLAVEYQSLFKKIDYLLVINAPSFDCVFEWRSLQEEKLRANNPNALGVMTEPELRDFISHYERLTSHCLATLAAHAHWVVTLDKDHNICNINSKVKHASKE